MGYQPEAGGIIDERIAGNAGGLLVGLAESAVNDQQFAPGLHGAFTLFGFYRDMAVDDVTVGTFQPELLEQEFTYRRVVVELIVGVFGLGPSGLVQDEPPLKGGHPVPAEDGAVAACPQKPQKVHAELPLLSTGLAVVGPAGIGVGIVQESLARQGLASDGKDLELAILGHGDAAVEEQVAVVNLVQAALGVEEADMALELFTVKEGTGELVDELILLGSEGIGVFSVHGGEVHILQRIGSAVDGDALVLIIDLVQQKPVGHTEAGVAQDLLPLQLEQNNGDGLVHPGGQQLVLFRIMGGVLVGELDLKAVDIAVLVHLVGKHRQGAQGDTIAGFDDLQVVVAEGVCQNSGHQGTGAGGRPHPQYVVVAPLNVHAVVLH